MDATGPYGVHGERSGLKRGISYAVWIGGLLRAGERRDQALEAEGFE